MEEAPKNININDLYTKQAFDDFINSKLYYQDSNLSTLEKSYLISKARSYETNPNSYLEYLNQLLREKRLEPDTVLNNIKNVLTTVITNIMRPHIYEIIHDINKDMEPYGQFIISGGEAFNLNVPAEFRRLTPDIDTKFVPFFGTNYDPSAAENKLEYIGLTLKIRVHFWYVVLEKALNKLNGKYRQLYAELLKPIESCPELMILGFKFLHPDHIERSGQPFRKRLSLMQKNDEADKNVFFDLNLFAIDLLVSNYPDFGGEMKIGGAGGLEIVSNSYISTNESGYIAGVLDCPFMRPDEFGYEIFRPDNNTSITIDSQPARCPLVDYQLLSEEQIRIIITHIPSGLNNPPPNLLNPERVQLLQVILELIQIYGEGLPRDSKGQILNIVTEILKRSSAEVREDYLSQLNNDSAPAANNIRLFIDRGFTQQDFNELLNKESNYNIIKIIQSFGYNSPRGLIVKDLLTNTDLVRLLTACQVSEQLLSLTTSSKTCLAKHYELPTYNFSNITVRIASRKFLEEDINTMIAMNLRTGKSSKDLYRQDVLRRIGIGNQVQPINIVQFETPQSLSFEQIRDVVSNDKLNYTSLSKILRIITPPTITGLQNGLFNTNILVRTFKSAQVTFVALKPTTPEVVSGLAGKTFGEIEEILSGPDGDGVRELIKEQVINLYISSDEAEKFLNQKVIVPLKSVERPYVELSHWNDLVQGISAIYVTEVVGSKFNYRTGEWVNCCPQTPLDPTCCDPIGDQFQFRIDSKKLSFFLYEPTQKIKEMMFSIFTEIASYIDNIIRMVVMPEKATEVKNLIGKMFIEYNPNYAADMDTTDVLDNVLMTAQSLAAEDPDFDNMTKPIVYKLLELRSKLIPQVAGGRQLRQRNLGTEPMVASLGEVVINPVLASLQSLSFITMKMGTEIYKAMDNITVEEASANLQERGRYRFEPTFYTTNKQAAHVYLESENTSSENKWALWQCKVLDNVKLINLTDPRNIAIILQNNILNERFAEAFKFMLGFDMTIAEQYTRYMEYLSSDIFGMKPDEYVPIDAARMAASNAEKDKLKRCSIMQLDVEVLRAMCYWFSNQAKELDVDGFYIENIQTYYCRNHSAFCSEEWRGKWHDEIIFCNRGKQKQYVCLTGKMDLD